MAALALFSAAAEAQQARSPPPSPPRFADLPAWNPAYKAPRTPFGAPDLQGVWTTASLTGLTRSGTANTLVIPEDSIRQITRMTLGLKRRPEGASRRQGEIDLGEAYNNFWLAGGDEFAKVNGEWRSSIMVSPANAIPPFTRDGRYATAQGTDSRKSGPEGRTPGDRCLMSTDRHAGPPLGNADYSNLLQIVQTPSHILLSFEVGHDTRIIRLRGRGAETAPAAAMPKWFGDSTGWWEGDTLVVETRSFHPIHGQWGGLLPLSAEAVVTERFSRVSPQEIFYRFTIDDPKFYTEQVRGETTIRATPERIYEYACHEGNYSMAGILRGERGY